MSASEDRRDSYNFDVMQILQDKLPQNSFDVSVDEQNWKSDNTVDADRRHDAAQTPFSSHSALHSHCQEPKRGSRT